MSGGVEFGSWSEVGEINDEMMLSVFAYLDKVAAVACMTSILLVSRR